MKKLINIAAILLAASMIFVGCSNGVAAPASSGSSSSSSGSNSTETTSYTTVTCTQGYAGPAWTVDTDWTKVTFEFAEVPSKMQINCTGDYAVAEQSWGTEYEAAYSGEITETSTEVVIADYLAQMTKGSTKVVSVTLQDMGDGDGVAKVSKVTLTKSDGTTEALTIPEPTWGYTLTESN